MECVLCKKPIKEDVYYAEVDIWGTSGKHYFTANCCAGCAAKFAKSPDEFVIKLHRVKNHKSIAKEPMRHQYGQWLFAKSQVEGDDYDDLFRLARQV